jgi:hypothetical protein
MAFEKIPVDGSEKMDDTYMDSIEPFDYAQIKDFQSEFLAGYVAEKYDVDVEKSKVRAEQRIKNSFENELTQSVVGYNSVSVERSAVNVENGNISYALFPVWVLNTKYKKENYVFMMNGQSGKLVGNLPVDYGKAFKYGALFAGIFGIIFTALVYFLSLSSYVNIQLDAITGTIAWGIAIATAFLIIHYWKSGMNAATGKTEANRYMVQDSLFFKEKRDRFLYSTTSKIRLAQGGANYKRFKKNGR